MFQESNKLKSLKWSSYHGGEGNVEIVQVSSVMVVGAGGSQGP